jgi:hypothetical protein
VVSILNENRIFCKLMEEQTKKGAGIMGKDHNLREQYILNGKYGSRNRSFCKWLLEESE